MQKFITRSQRDWLVRLVALGMLLLAAGCSAVRIGYANGETFLYWWLDGYVDFRDEQKPWVKEHIADFMQWHRKTQLRDYAQLLARTQQQIKGHVSGADVLNIYAAVKQRARVTIDHELPHLTDLALSITPEQISHLERKFDANNDTYRRDNLRGDLEYRQDNRFRKVMKQAEYWFGDFSHQQEDEIRAASNARPLDNELWMQERIRRQQMMIAMLKKIQAEKPPREKVTAMLKEYADLGFEGFIYREHKEFFDATRNGMAGMVAIIINVATPEQKAHAMKRLQKYIEDCENLAARQ